MDKQINKVKGNVSGTTTAVSWGRGGSSEKYIEEK